MFNQHVSAYTGASGLMQLMPATAKELGVTDINNPDQNIKAGITYLKKIHSYWDDIPDSIQRIKFTMASYNCGYGHVRDAQKLARKYASDTLNWDNGVDQYILKLTKPKYYNDEVVQYGYARGYEPYDYVHDIFDRYHDYKNLISQR